MDTEYSFGDEVGITVGNSIGSAFVLSTCRNKRPLF